MYRLHSNKKYHLDSTRAYDGPGIEVSGHWVVDTQTRMNALLKYLAAYDGVACVDTETFGWNTEDKVSPVHRARASCVTISTDDDIDVYVDNWGRNSGLIHQLRDWLENPDKKKTLHNAKFDMHVLANHGITLRGLVGDTMVMDFLLDTSARGQHDLETVYYRYFGKKYPGYRETFSAPILKKNGQPSKRTQLIPHTQWWDEGHHDKVVRYGCKDTRLGLEVYHHHKKRLQEVHWIRSSGRTYWDYYETFELPYTTVLWKMERRGVRLDLSVVREAHAKYVEIEQRSMEAFFSGLAAAGVPTKTLETFNPSSGKQLAKVLYDDLGLPILKRTPSKKDPQPSVDADTLESLASMDTGMDMGFLKSLLEARKAEKNRTVYAEYFLKWAPIYQGKLHTTFDQIGAETARLSSKSPNLQNIPIRTELGKLLRNAFVCDRGMKFVDADYSQIEVRMMAHRSGDPTMKRFIESGGDMHSLTAWTVMEFIGTMRVGGKDVDFRAEKERIVEVYGADPEANKVQPSPDGLKFIKANYSDLRGSGKTMSFAIQYGAGEMRAASVFGIPVAAGKRVIDAYFDTYEGLGPFMERRRAQAKQQGYIRTMFGRFCHLPHATSKSWAMQKAAERQAVNYDIQGSARDVIMAGMLLIDRDEELARLGAVMLLQVHDELLIQCPAENVEKVRDRVKVVMEDPYSPFGFKPMSVTTVAEVGVGDSWGSAH